MPRYTFGNFERERGGFVDPRDPEMRQHELGVAEVERGAIDRDRARALARHQPARRSRLHLHRHAGVGARRVERVVVGVVEAPVEAVRVQIATDDPRVGEMRAELLHAAHPVLGIDEREGGEAARPAAGELLDLLPARGDVLEVVRVERSVATDVAGGKHDGRDAELVHSGDELLGFGEAVLGIPAHRHRWCRLLRAHRPTPRAGRG